MKINILIIEDESIVAMDLEDTLTEEGYNVVATVDNGEEALNIFKNQSVDMLLCDINIIGDWDGIETVSRIMAVRQVPFIYLTALSDRNTIERAKQTFPSAYINKPFNINSLRVSIELALHNFAHFIQSNTPNRTEDVSKKNDSTRSNSTNLLLRANGILFVKQTHQFVKLDLNQLLYIEADNNYTTLVTTVKKFVLKLSLSQVIEHINAPQVVRVHRTFAVNITQIDSFNEGEIYIKQKLIPVGRSYKEEFIQSFQFS